MEKFIEISNALQAIVSTFGDKGAEITMLELRGAFKPCRISTSKVLFVLNNVKMFETIRQDADDKHYPIDDDTSVITSHFNGFKMYELRTGKPKRVSQNVINAILGHQKELRSIIAEYTPSAIQAEEEQKATKDLKQSSVNMPTDKKSPHDSKVLESAPMLSKNVLTIEKWLESEYKMSPADAKYYAMDVDAQTTYANYVKANVKPPFKDLAQPQTAAQQKAVANFENATGQKYDNSAPAATPANKGKGVKLSYTIRLVHNDKVSEQTIHADSWIDAHDNKLTGVRLANKDASKPTKLIVQRPIDTTGADKYLVELVRQGYVWNLKRDDGKAIKGLQA